MLIIGVLFTFKFRANIIFGLNALSGKKIQAYGSATRPWDSANSEYLMRYTVKKNYTMYAWELGNELSGSRVGTRVSASQYAFYTRPLANIVQFSFIYKFLLKHYLDDIVKYNVVTGRNGVGYVV